mgnify:CR=1 FL=1
MTGPLPEMLDLLRGLKRTAERAVAQVPDDRLSVPLGPDENSIAILMQHISGNQRSRWTDFLTTDGEKPDRARDTEFEDAGLPRVALLERWEEGWAVLFGALEPLGPDDLDRIVRIREEPHTVSKAILRQIGHYAMHVGQIVQLARHHAGPEWKTLSIPRGRSDEFLRRPPG